ncbi:hypothetical protein T439DRAFT_354244 [Meredithblackwellia eburnea MCA 4105]
MGRKIKGVRHCLPVDGPNVLHTAPTGERNVRIKPLTNPNGRIPPSNTSLATARSSKSKNKQPKSRQKPRKVGLGYFGESSDDEDHITIEHVGTSKQATPQGPGKPNALAESIASVLRKRPITVLEREDHEHRSKLQKTAASHLRRELGTNGNLISDQASKDDEDSDDDDLLVSSLLCGARTLAAPLSSTTTSHHIAQLGPVMAIPLSEYPINPTQTLATAKSHQSQQQKYGSPMILETTPMMSTILQTPAVQTPLFRPADPTSSPSFGFGRPNSLFTFKKVFQDKMEVDNSHASSTASPMKGVVVESTVEEDAVMVTEPKSPSLPLPAAPSIPPTNHPLPPRTITPLPSPVFTPATLPAKITIAPSSSCSVTPGTTLPPNLITTPSTSNTSVFPESSQSTPSIIHTPSQPSPAPRAANSLAVAAAVRDRAAAIIAGRTRNQKKKLKRRAAAELFDYDSSESEDWDLPLPTAGKRSKGGKALDGADPTGLPGGTLAQPDLLPATRRAAEKLLPTTYQQALLERAKVGNTITVLPTGSGKTLIAVLLIDWMFNEVEKPRIEEGKPKRLQFFLTSAVPLVHQQANILSHNSTVRVGKLFGALGVNLSSAEEWAWNFENYDCLVLTAQLLLDSLAHGFIHMSQIALLIVDEAHHAKSNHPFASILRDFYGKIPEGAEKPRILGLTASPLNSNEGLAEAADLQKLFDAQLITAPQETLQELREMVAKPTELTFKYRAPPRYQPTPLFQSIDKKVLVRDVEFDRYCRGALTALSELGPDASDLVWQFAYAKYAQRMQKRLDTAVPIIETIEKEVDPEFELIHPPMPEPEKAVDEENDDASDDDSIDLVVEKDQKSLQSTQEASNSKIPEWLREVQNHKSEPSLSNISPKLQTLIKVLSAYAGAADTFCGIVFVFSKTIPQLSWLRARCVTGHGMSASKALGPRMQWAEQAEVLTDFGEGKCNLLVATSVVEEGLDVQVRILRSTRRWETVQPDKVILDSRATSWPASTCTRPTSVWLRAEVVPGGLEAITSSSFKKADLPKPIFSQQQLLTKVETTYEDADFGDDEDDGDYSYYLEPSTNALLTPHFSISLLYRYCQSLPASDAFNSNIPVFELEKHDDQSFSCRVSLPTSARIRSVNSTRCISAKAAKRNVSFLACKLLRHVGALDEHLLPIRTFKVAEEVHDEEGRVIGSRKRQLGYEKKLADAWTITSRLGSETELHATLLSFPGPGGTLLLRGDVYQPFVLLTRSPIPSVPVISLFLEGQPIEMAATPLNAFRTSDEMRQTLLAYTLRVFTSTLNRSLDANVEEVLYFIAPLKAQEYMHKITVDDLDWKQMEHGAKIREEELKLGSIPDLSDRVIVDLGKNGCRYFFHASRPDLHPTGPLPAGRQSDAGYHTVIDYYMSFNEPLFHKMHIREDQPLFEVTRIPKVVSHLTPTPRNNVTPSAKKLLEKIPRFAIPQLCSRHTLPSSLFRTYLMLPSIITELDRLLLAQEVNAKIFKNSLDPRLVRAALTTPSACLEENYERLELLGDAFLKYVASVYCFTSLPKTAHEGDLHHTRLKHIQNATLFSAGLELNLPTYLFSRPFTSRLFIPPNFQLQRGNPPPHLASIGDKTIADVVEALLGAAYQTGATAKGLQGGFENALQAAIALKVDLVGITTWSDFGKLFGPLESISAISDAPIIIEQKLNHKFKHAYLLTEALFGLETHPSKLNASASFQRLEWLGDSILDFLVLGYCWDRWGGSLPPGHLTELKGAMVSNETLAALAIELDLDRYLAYDNPALTLSLEVYRVKLTKAKEIEVKQAEEEAREVRPYWLLLDAPKAVADIIESLFGAVFVDSGFDPAAPQISFDFLLAPFYAQWVSPTKLKIDAIRILLETAQSASCDDVSHISSTVDGHISEHGEIFPRVTKTSVLCHGQVLATVQTPNSKTAKRLVSANALLWLEQHPDFFARHCDCEKIRAIAREEAADDLERRRNEGLISEPDSDEDGDDEGGDSEFEGGAGKGGKEDEMEL